MNIFLKLKASLLILILLLFNSCGPPERHYPNKKIGALIVTYTSSMSKDFKRELDRGIAAHLEAWERDFGKTSNEYALYVTTSDSIYCGQKKTIGCTSIENNSFIIRVIAGDYAEVPALYHELCHANQIGGIGLDPNHQASMWPTWNLNGESIAASLRRRRENWLDRTERGLGLKVKYD